MEYYVTQTKDYWIASNAVNITLNALSEKNRIQGSVASGSVIMCFIEDIKAESEGGEPGNGDGLWYGANHEPKRWPLSLSPTYFNSNSRKYVYAAIPRSTSVGSQAVIVFPSEELDIYGRARRLQGEEETYEQIGSTDYFYVFLQGIIAEPAGYPERRSWEVEITDWGKLTTAQGIDEKLNNSEWYSYSDVTEVVTFLKEIVMQEGSSFRNLILNNKSLTDVAKSTAVAPVDSDTMVATPNYVEKFYLSKVHDDIAHGRITFEKGLEFLTTLLSVDNNGNKAREGFLDGLGIFMDANKGLIEADGMNIRGFMRVMELVINRLQLMESDYSFTEGDTTERVDWASNGQRMVLTMHKEHDNDHTPFYPGDILYAKINDLQDHGTYYTCWVRTVSVDLTNNTITVIPYNGLKPNTDPMVPGGEDFTFLGTSITTDYTDALAEDYAAFPDGYDKIINLTRHGNVADGLLDGDDPTSYSDSVLQAQKARQQAWVLSTTDKRLSFFWNVDQPIIKDENYALCLGILPDLANLPSTRNRDMPSLYVNTIFYDYQHNANYPAKVIKEDRGQWLEPDSTVPKPTCDYNGTQIYDPYHYRTFTNATWRQYRDDPAFASLTDEQLRQKMMLEFKVDLEISRAWNGNKLWECLVDGTTEKPEYGCDDWQVISGDTTFKADFEEDYQLYDPDNFKGSLTVFVMWGTENLTSKLLQQDIVWTRYTEDQSGNPRTASDAIWNAQHAYSAWPTGRETLTLRQSDLNSESEFPSLVRFRCEVTLRDGANNEVYNDIVEIEYD